MLGFQFEEEKHVTQLKPQTLLSKAVTRSATLNFAMNSLIGPVLQCLVLIISRLAITSDSLHIPRLSPIRSGMFRSLQSEALSASDPSEYETFYYNQTLDHFNFRPDSFSTFQQKYVINSKYWGGSNISAPIFAYLGAEVSLDSVISYTGFLPENANQFQALLIYIEVYTKQLNVGNFS